MLLYKMSFIRQNLRSKASALLIWSLFWSLFVAPLGISEAKAAVVTRSNAVNGTYHSYSFANAITGVTGNGSAVTFTFTPQTGTGANWRVGDFITVTFPSSDATTTAYNLGQVAITAITSNTFTVASTVKVDTAKYPNTVALSGLTSSSTGIRAGALAVTRDPNDGSTPNGCSRGGDMTMSLNQTYTIPKFVAVNSGAAVDPSVGFYSGSDITSSSTGPVLTTLTNCSGKLYIPDDTVSFQSNSTQANVSDIDFGSHLIAIQSGSLVAWTLLKALNLPNTTKYLGRTVVGGTGTGCQLSEMNLGNSLVFMGYQSFQRCPVTAVTLPNTIRYVGAYSFYASRVTEFSFPAGFACTTGGATVVNSCESMFQLGGFPFGADSIIAGSRPTGSDGFKSQVEVRIDYSALSPATQIALQILHTNMGYTVGSFPHLTFNNGDVVDPRNINQTFTPATPQALTANTFMRVNNTFVGWSTCLDELTGTDCIHYNNQQVLTLDASLTIYAQWSPIYTYTVNLNPGTSGTGTQMSAMTGTAATVILNTNTYSRTGYTFNGWNTSADGSGTSSYADQGTVRLTVDNQTVTLYAQWLVNTFTITYLPGPDGASTSVAQTLNYGGSVTLKGESAGFTRTGYSIVGWTTSSVSGAAKTNDLGSTYSTYAPITFYPVWGVGVYAITYNGQSSTTAASGGSTTYTTAVAIASIPTTAPLRSGYEFIGWFTTATTGGVQVTDGSYTPSSPYGAITLYARWSASTNNAITYDGQQATTAASGGSTTYTTASPIASIPTTAPLRSGYNFGGWFTASTGGTQVTDGSYTPSSPYGAITLYAQWSAKSNTATYDPQGGSEVPSGTFVTGGTISTAPSSIRTGYTIRGWTRSISDTPTIITFPYSPTDTAGFTLYAVWSTNVYAINFNYGSASSGSPIFTFETSTVSSTVSRGLYTYGAPALTLPTVGSMSKTGYSFAGWVLPNGDVLNSSTFTPTASTTLTAKWTIQSFSISYSRGTIGSNTVTGSAPGSQSGNYLSTIYLASTETSTTIADQRYDFAGWTISGTRYPIGSTIQLGAGDVIATAAWVPVYTVTYILSGGICIGTTCNDNPKADQSELFLPLAPIRTGFNFESWKDQSNRSYVAGETLTVTATSYILTATWLGIGRSVTYMNPNGVGIPLEEDHIYQSTFVVGVTPTRTGYDFGGWSDQGSAIYQSGDIYSVGLTNVTLTATWIPLGIVVTFFNNDGTSRSSNQSITAGSSTPLTHNALTRDGYSFGGWNTSSNGDGTPYSDDQNVNIVSTLNLHAQWRANTSNAITYDGQDATTPASGGSMTYTTAAPITAIPTSAPVRSGYEFGGWFTASTGGIRVTNGSYTPDTPYGAITLYARWSAIYYAVSYDGNQSTNGDAPTSASVSEATVITVSGNSGNLVRSGYSFGGWNTTSNSQGQGFTASGAETFTVSSAITFFAVWNPETYTVSFIYNGATSGDTTLDVSYTSGAEPVTLPSPMKSLFTFGGWYSDSATVESLIGSGGSSLTPVRNYILYAKWVLITLGAPPVIRVDPPKSATECDVICVKAAADKAPADKAAADKAAADKAAADKAAADNAAADKAAADLKKTKYVGFGYAKSKVGIVQMEAIKTLKLPDSKVIQVIGLASKPYASNNVRISRERALNVSRILKKLYPTRTFAVIGMGTAFARECTQVKNQCVILRSTTKITAD